MGAVHLVVGVQRLQGGWRGHGEGGVESGENRLADVLPSPWQCGIRAPGVVPARGGVRGAGAGGNSGDRLRHPELDEIGDAAVFTAGAGAEGVQHAGVEGEGDLLLHVSSVIRV